MPPKLDLIGIIVRDMPTSLTFYRALGLDIPPSHDGEGHAEITLPNGLRLAWDTHTIIQNFDAAWQPSTGHHRVAFAFLCDNPADVDATYARLTSAGYHGYNAPFDAPWGQRYAQIEDPDGNVIDLFAALS